MEISIIFIIVAIVAFIVVAFIVDRNECTPIPVILMICFVSLGTAFTVGAFTNAQKSGSGFVAQDEGLTKLEAGVVYNRIGPVLRIKGRSVAFVQERGSEEEPRAYEVPFNLPAVFVKINSGEYVPYNLKDETTE